MKIFFRQAFQKIVRDFLTVFSGRNLSWHFLAIALTAYLVLSGFDEAYFVGTRSQNLLPLVSPAIVGGALIPLLLPLILFTIGYIRQNRLQKITAGALAEATLLGSLISSIYKTFTGRLQPNWTDMGVDISHQFQFGFWRHGIFWGWPSSHTTIAFAMAFSFIYLFPQRKRWKILALLLAVYVGLGVSVSIHWFSDFIAGAIIGTVVGITVGKSFRLSRRFPEE